MYLQMEGATVPTGIGLDEAIKSLPGLLAPSGSGDPRRRLGDVIVDLGYADRELVERVMAEEANSNRRMGELLVASGILDPTKLAHALAERNGLPFIDLTLFPVDHGAANLLSATDARRLGAIPVAFLPERRLLVASGDPSNVLGIDDIAMATGYSVSRAMAAPEAIERLISRLSGLGEAVEQIDDEPIEEVRSDEVLELRASAEEAPVVKLVHSIIADAVRRGASDIHFEPTRKDMLVRFRVDGVVLEPSTVPKQVVAGLVSRVKIMAELDIAERRVPQDGRVALAVDGRHIDLRVSTLPVIRGESVVIRILDKDALVIDLAGLGMAERDRGPVLKAVHQVRGAVLVTGPTGAGKTTTMYSLLRQINTPDRTVISIEDPVEYEVEGVKQIHVNTKAGLTFAAGLRSMIRSDPDALMVGEIRDGETARIGMEAALTGHLVVSTLHTSDAATVPARLIDMGIEPFLVASGLECAIGQRLVRRLCDECKVQVEIPAEQLGGEPGAPPVTAFEPGGCTSCGGTGYHGRVALFEVLAVNEEIQELIMRRANGKEIAAAAARAGMRDLRTDGMEKVRAGVTSPAELVRVAGA
jgi:type IV pilus assembly protein PilB